MSFESSKAIAAKYKAIQQAVKEQNEKKAEESVRKPSKSYNNSRKSSKNRASSSSKSSKTDSEHVNQGVDTEKTGSSNGLTPPPGYTGPIPPQAPSIYDKDQPLAGEQPKNDSGMPKNTEHAVEQAPYSPIKTKSSGEANVEYYDVDKKSQPQKPKDEQKDTNIVMTQRRYGELKAWKERTKETGQTQIGWEPNPDAAYYTIKDKDFDPTYLHGPGSTKETAVDLYPNIPGWQLTPKQTDIYYENIGKENIKRAESVDLGENILDYTKKHAVFKVNDKEKTWEELKKENPALTLKKTNMQDVVIDYDYTKWYKKQDPRTKNLGRFFGGFANWDYIIETVGRGDFEEGTDIISKWTYEQSQRHKNKDYVGMAISTPAVQNIALPYAGGMAFGAVVRGGSALTSYVGSKGFIHTSKALSYGGRALLAGGTVAVGGLVVSDIAATKPDKQVAKTLTYGTQFLSFGAGSKAVQRMKLPKVQREIVEIKMPGEPRRMIGQKYVELFGKKIYSPKQTVAVGPRQAPVKVPKGFGSGKGLRVEPDLGFKTVGGKPTSIYNIRWNQNIQTSNWQGKTYFDTGGKWQPRTGVYKQVDYPVTLYALKIPMQYKFPGKPTVYGSYNMPYQSVLKAPMVLESGSFANITEGMVKVKPKKTPTFKDFNKEFRSIDQSLDQQPGVSQGQKQQTVQLLKLKQAQKQKSILQQQQKQAMDVLSKQKLTQKQMKKSMFHPEYRHQAIGQISNIKTVNAVYPIQAQGSTQAFALLSANMHDMQRKATHQGVYPVFATGTADATMSATIGDMTTKQKKVSPLPISTQLIAPKMPKPTTKFDYKPKIKTPKIRTGYFMLPRNQKKKTRTYDDLEDLLKQKYEFRKFDIPSLKKILRGVNL